MLSRVGRVAMNKAPGQVRHASVWDKVRPKAWAAVSRLEASLLDTDLLATRSFGPWVISRQDILPQTTAEDKKFFEDMKDGDVKPSQGQSYATYSFTTSSVLDEEGRKIQSSRKRYQDSAGRLKAVHEREIHGESVTTTWTRHPGESEGSSKTVHSDPMGDVEDFEREWAQTPFGAAEEEVEGKGGMDEVDRRTRGQAIAKGAKDMQEETTPIH